MLNCWKHCPKHPDSPRTSTTATFSLPKPAIGSHTRHLNDNGSQFYICVAGNSGLDRTYTIFGKSFAAWSSRQDRRHPSRRPRQISGFGHNEAGGEGIGRATHVGPVLPECAPSEGENNGRRNNLLPSCKARSQKTLVEHARWEIISPVLKGGHKGAPLVMPNIRTFDCLRPFGLNQLAPYLNPCILPWRDPN